MNIRVAGATWLVLSLGLVVLPLYPRTLAKSVWNPEPFATVFETPAQISAPLFRLGNAAQPFGYSTAVGDLNADGVPDVVVADRQDASRRTFRLEFSISGESKTFAAFQARDSSLTITVTDVDHDHDLDLVVTEPLSRRIVGIWLNDGSGHFQPTSVTQFQNTILAGATIQQPPPSSSAELAGSSTRRSHDLIARTARPRAPADGPLSTAACDGEPAISRRSFSARPRAPPVFDSSARS